MHDTRPLSMAQSRLSFAGVWDLPELPAWVVMSIDYVERSDLIPPCTGAQRAVLRELLAEFDSLCDERVTAEAIHAWLEPIMRGLATGDPTETIVGRVEAVLRADGRLPLGVLSRTSQQIAIARWRSVPPAAAILELFRAQRTALERTRAILRRLAHEPAQRSVRPHTKAEMAAVRRTVASLPGCYSPVAPPRTPEQQIAILRTMLAEKPG